MAATELSKWPTYFSFSSGLWLIDHEAISPLYFFIRQIWIILFIVNPLLTVNPLGTVTERDLWKNPKHRNILVTVPRYRFSQNLPIMMKIMQHNQLFYFSAKKPLLVWFYVVLHSSSSGALICFCSGIRNTTRSYLIVSNTRSYRSYLDTRYEPKLNVEYTSSYEVRPRVIFRGRIYTTSYLYKVV